MPINQIPSKSDGEHNSVRRVIKNVGSATATKGSGVAMVTSAVSCDGIQAVANTAALIAGFSGIVLKDIAVNAYGLAVVDGFVGSVLLSHVGSSITISAGDVLKPGAVAGTFFSSITAQAMSTLLYKYVIAGSTNTISAQAWVKGVVKA